MKEDFKPHIERAYALSGRGDSNPRTSGLQSEPLNLFGTTTYYLGVFWRRR